MVAEGFDFGLGAASQQLSSIDAQRLMHRAFYHGRHVLVEKLDQPFRARVVAGCNGPEVPDLISIALRPTSIQFGRAISTPGSPTLIESLLGIENAGTNLDVTMTYDFNVPRRKNYLTFEHRISALSAGTKSDIRQLIARVSARGPGSEKYVRLVYNRLLGMGFQ